MAIIDKGLRKFALLLIRGYQLFLSPLMGGGCRFYPTCSEYAKEVFVTHSFIAALWLTIRRLLRCHPWCDGGDDPPPHSGEITS